MPASKYRIGGLVEWHEIEPEPHDPDRDGPVYYYDKEGRRIKRTEWMRLTNDFAYCVVRREVVFSDNIYDVETRWVGVYDILDEHNSHLYCTTTRVRTWPCHEIVGSTGSKSYEQAIETHNDKVAHFKGREVELPDHIFIRYRHEV